MLLEKNVEKKWERVREAFELDPSFIHLALGMLTPHPFSIREAISYHRQQLDRNPALYYRNKDVLENQILGKAADYLETVPQQIALTESTTMGLALVYNGLSLEEGDEILASVHEHYAARETLRFKAKREKIKVNLISLYKDALTAEKSEIVNHVLQGITKRTRLIALTWVHSCTGVKLPIREIVPFPENKFMNWHHITCHL